MGSQLRSAAKRSQGERDSRKSAPPYVDSARGDVTKNRDGEVVFNSGREWRTKDGSEVDVNKPREKNRCDN